MMNFHEQIKNKITEELLEIYTNPDDYQDQFVSLVEKELVNRGLTVENYAVQKKENAKSLIEQYEEGRNGSGGGIFAGFLFCVIGSPIGLLVGLMYSMGQVSDASGKKYYRYNGQTRQHGKIMVVLSIAAMLLYLAILNGEFE